jgi:nucleotide sugar dehydrogenase
MTTIDLTNSAFPPRQDDPGVVIDVPHERALPEGVGSAAVVGLGYVGLPTALHLLEAGLEVVGVDVSPARLAAIRDRSVDLLPADQQRLPRALAVDGFTLTQDPSRLAEADAVLICVPTPVDGHQVPDLEPLRRGCAAVVDAARPGQTIVLTSTTYVHSTRDLLAVPLARRGLEAGEDVWLAFSPERIDPGNARFPQERVPRVVGGVTKQCGERAASLIRLIVPAVHVVGSPEVAEMTKLYENTFRAVNIALANELAEVSRALELDVAEVITAASTKPYGFMPFYPGPGIGGHCIPCDPHYLLWQLRERRVAAPLIAQAMQQLAVRPIQVVQQALRLLAEVGQPLARAKVLVVGAAYKPGVQDSRETPALDIIAGLLDAGVQVGYYDPLVPRLRLRDGRVLESVGRPDAYDWHLAIVHTLHPGVDYAWLSRCHRVFDATYGFAGAPA